jgi:hypothetical protein
VFTFYAGLCPASEVLQCCVEGGPGGEICYDQSDDDKCMDKNEVCEGGVKVASSRLCPNKHSSSCCIKDPQGLASSCSAIGGECTANSDCQAIPGSKSLSGKCPGSNLITCCIKPPPTQPPPRPTYKKFNKKHFGNSPASSTKPPKVTSTPDSSSSPEVYTGLDPQREDDLDDCGACVYLLEQATKTLSAYPSRQWYYYTLAQLCNFDDGYWGGLRVNDGNPYRTSIAFKQLYPTCNKLFGVGAVVDDVITELLNNGSPDDICHSTRLCLIKNVGALENTASAKTKKDH